MAQRFLRRFLSYLKLLKNSAILDRSHNQTDRDLGNDVQLKC